MLLGYARVSRDEDQSGKRRSARSKLHAFRGCFESRDRAGTGTATSYNVCSISCGLVTCWKLDRLTRSLKDLLHLLEKLDAASAGFRSLTESIDTDHFPQVG